ncbi:MAG: hypothetical protein LBI92_04395 [Azoarcus sp.]|nr:hypothetical protein [Azoarcus sp.]
MNRAIIHDEAAFSRETIMPAQNCLVRPICLARSISAFGPVLLVLVLFLAACAKDDPRAALDAAATEFQSALEAKATRRALALLHPDFTAQDIEGDGRKWAERTMTMMFMRYKNVTIAVPWRRNTLDARIQNRATTEAEATLLGAEGFLPDRVRHYRVRLEWRREQGSDWKVVRLEWK